MPAAPPPPGLLTIATGTGTSFSSVMILWMTRAIRSAPPPTANGTTNSTSLVGFHPCASAAHGMSASARTFARNRIGFLLLRKNYTRPHGHVDRGRLARRPARHEIHRRGVRQAGKRVPRSGTRRARSGPLPALRREKLPLGAPHARRARAEGTGKGGAGVLCRSVHGRERLGIFRRGNTLSLRALRESPARLHRPRDGAHAVGRSRAAHRQQRIVRNHPDAEPRVRSAGEAQARRPVSRKVKKGNRLAQRTHLPHGQQRRLPGGVRHGAGQVRGGGDRALSDPGLAGKTAFEAQMALRRLFHRGRRAALHYTRALRRGLLLAFQVQPAAAHRIPEALAPHAAGVRATRSEVHDQPERNKRPLLPQHEENQSRANRAQRAVAGFLAALTVSGSAFATSDPLDGVLAPGESAAGLTVRIEPPSPYVGYDRHRSEE